MGEHFNQDAAFNREVSICCNFDFLFQVSIILFEDPHQGAFPHSYFALKPRLAVLINEAVGFFLGTDINVLPPLLDFLKFEFNLCFYARAVDFRQMRCCQLNIFIASKVNCFYVSNADMAVNLVNRFK